MHACKTDPNFFDSMDKGTFLVENIGGTTIPMMTDTVDSCSVVPMLFESKPDFVKQHELLVSDSRSVNHKSAVPIRVFDPGGLTYSY